MTIYLQLRERGPKVVSEVAIWPYGGGNMNLRFAQEALCPARSLLTGHGQALNLSLPQV